jgi:hypothetical protein
MRRNQDGQLRVEVCVLPVPAQHFYQYEGQATTSAGMIASTCDTSVVNMGSRSSSDQCVKQSTQPKERLPTHQYFEFLQTSAHLPVLSNERFDAFDDNKFGRKLAYGSIQAR